MKIDEILAEMPNLSSQELNAIQKRWQELEFEARKRRMAERDLLPWPPPRDPKRDEFIAWLEAQPDDDLSDDPAHYHVRCSCGARKLT